MPIRTITLTAEQGALLDAILATGCYADASAALDDALAALRRATAEAADLEAGVEKGIAALEAAALTEVDDADLDRFLDGWAQMGAGAR